RIAHQAAVRLPDGGEALRLGIPGELHALTNRMCVLEVDGGRCRHGNLSGRLQLGEQPGRLLGRLGADLFEIDTRRQTVTQHDLSRVEGDVDRAYAGCECGVPCAVGVFVVELDAIVAALGKVLVRGLEPRPHDV